ncbi:hypothetical protein L210DRAFT_3630922 [Boletus edulis BED1]|uniref:Uncharacterized protein n=1 Tax=Boletus edulis BED1 TaxID=1328754 RepID=A0AAD4GEI5_BOLED|nr:hypothetical protein L210DRAFT_3630922 [Boletus edulis BED1]
MSSYIELIKKDVCCHQSCDASSWPFSVSEFIQSLKNDLKIPSWFKSGLAPYINKRVTDLVHQLRASDDAFNIDLWDSMDRIVDKEMEQRLHVVFNTALIDCARIRAAVKAERLTDTPYPKESFLVILVRNAILDAHVQLSSLEDIPVVLPRHFSGEAIPILNYMEKSFHAPLVISISQEIPVDLESSSGVEHQSNDEEDSSIVSELFKHSPPTLSEWLDASGTTPEEVEEEQAEVVPPPPFEAHFFTYRPSMALPSTCHIPVLCMADEEQLSVLMSSLLYQRRVWRISDPLIGLEFSKYDTMIRLFVGWLEEDPSSDRVLPRVHLGEIGTPVKLDLSSPSAVLVVSRLLCSLESHVSAMHDSVRHSVGAVISETQSYSALSWRIDTDIRKEDPILEYNNTRETVIQWVKSQKYSECEGAMPPRKKADKTSLHGSATSAPSPQQSTSTQPSHTTPPSSVPPKEGNVPELREPRKDDDGVPTFCSHLSCSKFAATSEKSDYRMFRWMFDRRVIPQCIPSDLEFREEYSAMTGFIWPDTWHDRKDLPLVDAALEPCVQELLKSVATLKTRPGAVKCIPAEEFPVDLRILQQSFSAIFQASRRSREKGRLQEKLYEAAWRHDHDRLLFDFFIRLVQPRMDDAVHAPPGDHSIADLEDPLSRPTLETTLRFPKSDNLQRGGEEQLQEAFLDLLNHQAPDLRSWLRSRGGSLDAILQENGNYAYVLSQFSSWARETNAETEGQMISRLGQFPSKGRCDALGRLLVELPKLSSKDVGHLALVDHPAGKHDSGGGRNEVKASARSEASAKTSKRSLTVPDASAAAAAAAAKSTNGMRYSIPLSSISTSMQSLDKEQMDSDSEDSVEALTHKTQRLQLGPDATYLELPILAVEYKKVSDDLVKGTNQLRMYLTASVKFLQAVGITNVPVYGVQTDGSVVVLPAAVLRDDNFVYLFERLVERLDISTPLGAWHYATILCRLAKNHAKVLENKFEGVKEKLVASLLRKGDLVEGWTRDDQIDRLIAENKAKKLPSY